MLSIKKKANGVLLSVSYHNAIIIIWQVLLMRTYIVKYNLHLKETFLPKAIFMVILLTGRDWTVTLSFDSVEKTLLLHGKNIYNNGFYKRQGYLLN